MRAKLVGTALAAINLFWLAWWIATAAGHLNRSDGIAIGVFLAGVVTAIGVAWAVLPSRGWSPMRGGRRRPTTPPPQPLPHPHPDPLTAHDRVLVGDLPGEAVAWQERGDLLDRLETMASSGPTTVVC